MKNFKSFITNQSRRKINFITSPINMMNKSNYNHQVMTYAKYYGDLKVKDHQILYQVRNGKNITGNPYAIFLYLVNQKEYKRFLHKWVVDSKETLNFYKNKFKNYNNVDFVIIDSSDYLKSLAESKYLINDSTFPLYFAKKENQIYINTWHGTPLKYMGLDMDNNVQGSQNIIKNFLSSDYIISSNRHTTNIFKSAFNLHHIYNGEILEKGYPRIDLTLKNQKSLIFDTLNGLISENEEKILLYCPTWRGEDLNNPDINIESILNEAKELEAHLNYKVLVKVHPFIYEEAKKDCNLKNYLISDYVDTNELLAIVDLMVTDYSSIFFDYLVTNKPIIFYTPDYDDYKFCRGMYINPNELPGPVCTHIEDVISSINNKSYENHQIKNNYEKFKTTYVSLEDGHASKNIVEHIFNRKVESPKRNTTGKKTILIYPGGMKNNGITTSIINLLENIDYHQYDITIFLNYSKKEEMLSNLDRVNPNVRIIFRRGPLLASLKECYKVDFVKQRGLQSFLEKFLYPKKVYQREFRKIFGDSHFDYAIDFSGYSMFWANLILASNAKRKLVYLHSDIKADMERRINGVRPHYQNLKGLVSLYPYFDKLVSVSEATSLLNKEKINNPLLSDKYCSSRNTINLNKIHTLVEDDSDRFEKNGESVLINIKNGNVQTVEFSNNDFKIVSIGRLSPEKGFDLLINAVAKLVPKYPNIKLYIMGEGPLKKSLQSLIKKLKMRNHVFLLGHRKNPFYVMKQSNLFALTSHYEGQSMVLLEALTLGVNVLASDIVANRYVLKDGKYGTLVINEIEEIAKGIETFILGQNEKYEKFDAEAYNAKAIKEFYDLLQ
ncbi:glycosyltransferase [Staphylococcus caprae]|uniref:glycosyltransferase n=2 Tax=Staphylococcus caprae TaxID=29380 RepID=UPI0030C4FB33